MYSVMQSDGNSFCGDVVLDSFNMLNMDEDSILDQSMKSKHFRLFITEILNFISDFKKMHICRNTAQYNKELIKIGFNATVVLVCIFA